MQSKQTQLPAWAKAWMAWPRWAQTVSLVGVMGLMAAAWLLTGDGSSSSAKNDLFNDPVLLSASVFLKLAVVVILMVAAAWIVRRVQGGSWKSVERQVKVIETTHLTPRRAIHLVQVGDRKLLIGATDQSISLLTEVDDQPAGGIQSDVPFSELLSVATQPSGFSERK
jgi:flagellar biosynthetic protein FliO